MQNALWENRMQNSQNFHMIIPSHACVCIWQLLLPYGDRCGLLCYMCEQGWRNLGFRGAQFCYCYRNKPVSTKYFVLLSVLLDFQTFLRHWLGFAALAAVAKALNTDCPVKICDFHKQYIVLTVIQLLTYRKSAFITRSWILTIHKNRIFWKNLLEN